MSIRNKRVAVLGGSRFIGYAVVEALLAKGCRVITVNRGRTPVRYTGPVGHVMADRMDPAGYSRALAGIDTDCVVDMTAYQPTETRVVLDAFRGRIARLVHISTLSVYRWPFSSPVSEDAPLETNPCNTYGFEKVGCERLLFSESTVHLPWTILRLPPVFGPGDPVSREVWLYRQIFKKKPIVVPPRPYRCQNLFISDAAEAVCALIESPRAAGRIYNAGGFPFTLEEYVDLLAGFAGMEPQMIRAERWVLEQSGADPQKIPYFFEGDLVLDTRRIFNETGFTPQWDLKKGVAAIANEITASGQWDSGWWGLPWDSPGRSLRNELPARERPEV